jgi:hypothetical protein
LAASRERVGRFVVADIVDGYVRSMDVALVGVSFEAGSNKWQVIYNAIPSPGDTEWSLKQVY